MVQDNDELGLPEQPQDEQDNQKDEGKSIKKVLEDNVKRAQKAKDTIDRTKNILDLLKKGKTASQAGEAAQGAGVAGEAAGTMAGEAAAGSAAGSAAGGAATAGAAAGGAATGGAAAAAGGTAAAGGAAGAAGGAATAGAAAGGAAVAPWVIAAILIAVGLILIYLFFFSHASALEDTTQTTPPTTTSGGNGTQTNAIPGLTITLTGDPTVGNGQNITYTVSYTYDQTVGKIPAENIVLFDTIPQNATFVSTTGIQGTDSTPQELTFSLQDPGNQKPFQIVLHPTTDDSYVNNTMSARLAAGTGTASATGDPPDFLALVTGQGRNLTVLGDRAGFIQTIVANSSGLSLAGKESYLGQIYDAGLQYNVNPLILAVIWGTESGFDPSATYPFGCLNPSDAGFAENVTCSAGSLNQLMSTFETHNTGGSLEIPSTTGNTCIYTDEFVYAYEMYAPICHASDHNDAARGNFTSFYKKFKGL